MWAEAFARMRVRGCGTVNAEGRYPSSPRLSGPIQREPPHAAARGKIGTRLNCTRYWCPPAQPAAQTKDHEPHERSFAVHASEVADVVDAFARIPRSRNRRQTGSRRTRLPAVQDGVARAALGCVLRVAGRMKRIKKEQDPGWMVRRRTATRSSRAKGPFGQGGSQQG